MSKNAIMPMDDYKGACDKVREKLGTEDLIKSGELPEKINEVYEAGQKDEHDSFWDAYQNYGNRTDYRTAFAFGWTDAIFRPKYDIVLNQKLTNWNSQQAFEACEVQDIAACLSKNNATIDTSQAENLDSVFRTAKTVSLPPLDLSNCLKMGMTFYYMAKLKSLELRNLREDCTFDRPISFCYALEELRITGTIGNNGIDVQYSPLTKESLLNVIDCLKNFREITTITTKVPSAEPITITNGTLEEGKQYTWSYYDAVHPGWVIDDATSYPTSEEVQITSTAGKVVVNGKEYIGFKASYTNYVNTPHVVGGYEIYVYQDGNEIKTVAHKGMGGDDIIKLNIPTTPTETHSITFGASNLAKLTDAEKAVATQKGWTLA